jgi:carbon monoxide dehydrogenase subunit G
MEITGSHTFRASIERMSSLLLDPDLLTAAIPGCERLIQFGPPDTDGATYLEARIRSDEPATTRIIQIALHPEGADATKADLRWHEDAAGANQTREATCELRLETQDDATVGAWTFHSEVAPDGLTEDDVQGFAERLCANLDAALERKRQQPVQGEISAGNELFVRTPYGTIMMARPEPVWGGWVRAAALVGGIALALGGVIALVVTITRALNERRQAQDLQD